jgi:hypothetical protein
MKQIAKRNYLGFTMVELIAALAMALVVVLTVGVVMSGSHSSWNQIYSRIYSDVVTDAYMAKAVFDSICRKSSNQRCLVDAQGEFAEVYYYEDVNNIRPDKYATFYLNNQNLMVDYGDLVPGTWNPLQILNTVRLARHVQDVDFFVSGNAVTVILNLNDGSQAMTVMCSSIRHID